MLRLRALARPIGGRGFCSPALLTFGEALYTFKPLPPGAPTDAAMPAFAPGACMVLRAIGGAELNTAVAVSKASAQGGGVGFVSLLPSGALGDEVLRVANEAGVATAACQRSADSNVLGTLHVVDADSTGPRPFYQRHGSAFCTGTGAATHDWPNLLYGARWLHLTGITPALGAGPRAAWDSALSAASAVATGPDAPLCVSLDLNHRPSLGSLEELWSAVRPHLPTLTLLMLSEDTLRALAAAEGLAAPLADDEVDPGMDAVDMLAQLREAWGVPLLGCTFKRPIDAYSPATVSAIEYAHSIPLPQGHPYFAEDDAQRIKDTTHGGRGVRRWSVLAHPGGIASTEQTPTEHTPVEVRGCAPGSLAGAVRGVARLSNSKLKSTAHFFTPPHPYESPR